MTRYEAPTWKGTVLLFTGMLITFSTSAYRWCKEQLCPVGRERSFRRRYTTDKWLLLKTFRIPRHFMKWIEGHGNFFWFCIPFIISWETFIFYLTWICRCLKFKVLIKRLFNDINIPHNDLTLVMQSIAAFRIVVWLSSYCCFTGETEWRVQGNSTSN